MELLSDIATELCVRVHRDEGLLAAYSSVEFLKPVRAGDFLEVRGTVDRVGTTSLGIGFEIVCYARAFPQVSDSSADLVDPPETVLRAAGTCVVPSDRRR